MPRNNRRSRRQGAARFWVQLEHWLLDTPAWRDLSANAKVVYVEVKRRYNGKNNGLLFISAREAGDALNASHHTGARALLELQEHGLIAVTEDSSFNRKVHIARQYRLTEAADDRPGFSRIPTKDFVKWKPEQPETKKTQSHGCDATVSPMRRDAVTKPEFALNSLTHATVRSKIPISQSHPCDTIRLSASQPPKREAV